MRMAWPGARRLLSAQRRPGAARGDMSTAPQSGNLLLLSSRWGPGRRLRAFVAWAQ